MKQGIARRTYIGSKALARLYDTCMIVTYQVEVFIQQYLVLILSKDGHGVSEYQV